MAILPNHWTELGRRHIDGLGENDRLFSSFFSGHSVADRVELHAGRSSRALGDKPKKVPSQNKMSPSETDNGGK
ncbi:hypothetical protein TNCV_4649071 [Trichonephila clavipes]|uniref:Uncharacterized protein n=1 Tax=Trichonephila clavipes TaxID=2585209 RepID=A0A8X6SXF5_TRICX|nr:hypothetical protein TNCV_4649071 [Trichonephila clavipes]